MLPVTRYAHGEGGDIAYQVVGDGPIDLVFMSAWFSHVDGRWEEPSFARMLRRLASFSRLLVFDKRGVGASDPLPADTTTWEEWADDVRAVMDAAGSERAAIVGVGDSGPIAMLFAATYPDRVQSLVLVNTAARFTRTSDYPYGHQPQEVEDFLRLQRDTWGRGGTVEALNPSMAADERYRSWWSRYQRMSASPSTSRRIGELIFGMDVRQVPPSIRVPTLVVHRSGLQMVPVGHGRYLAEHIPGAKYVELPGQDYFVYIGNTEAILDEIEEFVTGARRAHEIDRVLATVMFTDIVGSTDRAAALGDRRWRDLIDAHDALVRSRLEEFRGRWINSTGDGFLATFDGPARAVRGAFAIRDSLADYGIRIRSGLHTGEVELRDGGVGGIAVHIGARVMAEAGEDEVLVSSTVKDLVTGSGIRFEERGVRQLKGVPEPWRLYAAVA
jgi:pimeloyl-ACP methyl ester carboxylesterase/class 3 adenylate cyclase